MSHKHHLTGCSPTPLAHYLKGLGLLRILADQTDSSPRGWWRDEDFIIETELDPADLQQFLLEDYQPTPIINPWNGGSGFKLGSPKDAVVAARAAEADRLEPVSTAVGRAFGLMEQFGVTSTVKKDNKDEFLKACRSRMPDKMLPWIDAALVLTDDRTVYPPLLGTGGNDGNLDFSINFLQQLQNLFDLETGEPTHAAGGWLEAALYRRADSHMDDGAVGQFFPSSTGGANRTTGFEGDTQVNPWDFVLMLEGTTMFASAAVRKLESGGSGAVSAPFTVHHVGVGHGSADAGEEDDAHDEMWMPLWSTPASDRELQTLFAEGRAVIDGKEVHRPARDGVDFARAIATLGVDRGLEAFQRFGFQERNGQSYFATPLGRLQVRRQPNVELVDEIDDWLNTLSRRTQLDDNVPFTITAAVNRLQEAIFDLCVRDDASRVQRVLVEFGRVGRLATDRLAWFDPSNGETVDPLSGLSARWVVEAADGTPEFRLACTLASTYGDYGRGGQSDWRRLRCNLEPVETYGPVNAFWKDRRDPEVVWHGGDVVDALVAVVRRRAQLAVRTEQSFWPDRARVPAQLADINQFLNGNLDEYRLADLTWGMLGIDWRDLDRGDIRDLSERRVHPAPGAAYGLTKLCFAGRRLRVGADRTMGGAEDSGIAVPVEPAIVSALASGDARRATERAARRLRGCELPPSVESVPMRSDRARRLAAALLFPIEAADATRLLARVTHALDGPDESDADSDESPRPTA